MVIRPCAKINLGLNIVANRPDGYHDLQTVFYPVAICDEIDIRERPAGCCGVELSQQCTLSVSGMEVCGRPEDNLVVKAYRLLAADYRLPPVHISLQKQIPMQAGMGGGSSDGAFTLRLLNEMFQLGLSDGDLLRYAVKLGADCAFFVKARPAYAEGIGDLLEPVNLDLSAYQLVVVKPPLAISTREAFAGVQVRVPPTNCKDAVSHPVVEWRWLLSNDFEASLFPHHPELPAIKQTLYDAGALYAAMSGSGSAFFGIFKNAPDHIEKFFPNDYVCYII